MKTIKLFVTLFLILGCVSAQSADYYFGSIIDDYDPASGLYYRSINKKEESHGLLSSAQEASSIVNISIFDPVTEVTNTLFPESFEGTINFLLYESTFRDGMIQFFGTANSNYVKNNNSVSKRELRNKLLIFVRKPGQTGSVLYVSDKRGRNLTMLASLPQGASWHLDVRNAKIRIVSQVGTKIRIENLEW